MGEDTWGILELRSSIDRKTTWFEFMHGGSLTAALPFIRGCSQVNSNLNHLLFMLAPWPLINRLTIILNQPGLLFIHYYPLLSIIVSRYISLVYWSRTLLQSDPDCVHLWAWMDLIKLVPWLSNKVGCTQMLISEKRISKWPSNMYISIILGTVSRQCVFIPCN